MIFTNSIGERMQYENALKSLKGNSNISQTALDNCVLTQSYLRSIVALNNTQNRFQLPVLSNQTGSGVAVRPDEQRLNQQDAFYVSKINVYIFNSSGYNWVPKTYPSTAAFTTGAASLYALYNGKISIEINNSTIVPGYPMLNFMQIPQTQFTAATNSPVDQFDGTLQLPWEPNVCFVGTFNTLINVVLPVNIATIDANTYLVVQCQGVLAQNVALGAVQ